MLIAIGVHGSRGDANSTVVVDAADHRVRVACPIKRIVALNEDCLEVLRLLDASSLVVGVDNRVSEEPLFWAHLKELPSVGRWNEPSYEKIATLHPDLVICYRNRPGYELENKLKPLGIQVLRLDFYKMSTMAEEIQILAKILGKEKEANNFLNWYRKKLSSIQKILRCTTNKPMVYLESYSDYHALGPGSGGFEMGVLAGGNIITSAFSITYPEVTSEWILSINPDVIVKAVSVSDAYVATSGESLKKIWKRIVSRPGWDQMRAVRKHRVYVMASDICAGPRAIVGIAYMARWFHPEVAAKVDPLKIHHEYLEQFQHVKYRGSYVYPE